MIMLVILVRYRDAQYKYSLNSHIQRLLHIKWAIKVKDDTHINVHSYFKLTCPCSVLTDYSGY